MSENPESPSKGLPSEPAASPDTNHLLFKWRYQTEPRTIELHREIAEREGAVWWGRFTKSPQIPALSDAKLRGLRAQISRNELTYAFLYRTGGGDAWSAEVQQITPDSKDVDAERFPTYYTPGDCNLFALLTNFERLPTNWAEDNLVVSSTGDPAGTRGALRNQRNPMLMQIRPSQGRAGQPPSIQSPAGAIPVGITREDVLEAIRDFDEGAEHSFGPSSTYDLIHEGRRYPPKAVLGLAARRAAGRTLRPHEFPGGEDSQCFRVLRGLGFEIVLKADAVDAETSGRPRIWAMSLGEGGDQFEYCWDEGIIGIGWRQLGDLRHYEDREAILAALREHRGGETNPTNNALCNWQFANEMQPGDIVIAKAGQTRLLGAGVVESEYLYEPERSDFTSVRRVRWVSDRKDTLSKRARVPMKTLTDVTTYRAFRDVVEEAYPEVFDQAVSPIRLPHAPTGSIWIEVTRSDHQHGGAGWEFGTCLWSPSRSADGKDWYRLMREPTPGDLVIHVYDATICGFSIVEQPFREVSESPPAPGPWADMAPFYRVDLREYQPFPKPVPLSDFIREHRTALAREIEEEKPHRYPFQLERSGLVKSVQGAYLCRATSNLFDLIRLATGVEVGDPETDYPPYVIDEAMEGLFIGRTQFEAILEALERRKNVVLQGPPGVGKSFMAKRLAYALLGFKDPDRVEMLQFHQSYSYEDFVQGWRPKESGGFERKNGIFYDFCRAARDGRPRVFIIDEINRGNLSKIFGELMLLVEHDKRGEEFAIPLTYSSSRDERFYIPGNVHIIGLMNTADRSLAMVDYALRRRFVFFDLIPQFASDAFSELILQHGGEPGLVDRIVERMAALNQKIAADTRNLGHGFCIGHSFFCPTASDAVDDDWYRLVVTTEIAPLIREYWFDDPEVADKLTEELLADA